MDIKITHQGEDYISVEVNGEEKELNTHDGKAIRFMLKAISAIFNAYN